MDQRSIDYLDMGAARTCIPHTSHCWHAFSMRGTRSWVRHRSQAVQQNGFFGAGGGPTIGVPGCRSSGVIAAQRFLILAKRNLTVIFLRHEHLAGPGGRKSVLGITDGAGARPRVLATKRGLVQTGDTPETLAATLFPRAKRVRVDKGRGDIKGADNAERVVAKRDGALFALGPSRVEVCPVSAFALPVGRAADVGAGVCA